MSGHLTLSEVAQASGLPERTIRFYIARGLMNGPVKGGRAAAYTAEHVARLKRIQQLQTAGRTLSEISRILSGPSKRNSRAEPPTAWWQHTVADDVIVWVRSGASPWRTKQLSAALQEFARRVEPPEDGKGKESEDI